MVPVRYSGRDASEPPWWYKAYTDILLDRGVVL